MKGFSSLEKRSYLFEDLYKLCEFSSTRDLAEALFYAISKNEVETFVIVKLPFEMFRTNISFRYETIGDIPNKLSVPFGKELISIYPEYVEVRYRVL